MNKVFLSLLSLQLFLVGCSNSNANSSGITSSKSVGGEALTMQECKYRLKQTAQKYNVSYTVDFNKPDYFSAKLIKNGIQSDLIAICDKKGGIYEAIFQIPD